jgi:hypothetical protein
MCIFKHIERGEGRGGKGRGREGRGREGRENLELNTHLLANK